MKILNKDGRNYMIEGVNFIQEEYEVSKVSQTLSTDWKPIYIMGKKELWNNYV